MSKAFNANWTDFETLFRSSQNDNHAKSPNPKVSTKAHSSFYNIQFTRVAKANVIDAVYPKESL